MSMGTCKACGKPARKMIIAYVLTGVRGGITGARVCQACAAGGVLLVAPKLAPVVKSDKTGVTERFAKARRELQTLARMSLRGPAPQAAKAEAYEGAIELLKRIESEGT